MDQKDVGLVFSLFEDMDYSVHSVLRDLDHGTMLAVGRLLWSKDVEITSDNLKRAALAYYGYMADENEFASSADTHFMDLCDDRKFSSGLMDRIVSEVTDRKIREFHERGWYVVQLRRKHAEVGEHDEGYYVFTAEAIVK